MTTVRKVLAESKPHVSTKSAWRLIIQFARQQTVRGPLAKRAAVEAMLNATVTTDMDIGSLKRALYGCVNAANQAERSASFDAVEAFYKHHVPPIFAGTLPVKVNVVGVVHPIHGIDRWLGTTGGRIVLDARDAVRLHHHLDRHALAGGHLSLSMTVPEGQRLPPLRRGQRARKPTRNHQTWLPHTDSEGRFSASPRSLADLHAKLLGHCELIIDPFCGAGADAIGFALNGKRVLASDTNAERLDLAMRNARHFGVLDSIEFALKSADHALMGLVADRRSGVYLDPPWGGPGSTFQPEEALTLLQAVPACVDTVLKVPRDFPVAVLPTMDAAWNVHLGLDVEMVDPADRLKTLALHRTSTI
ncbi:MAG: hypothetical protein VX127_05435 [Myxococcota bacterium]|nr:hypothetical protein [Myxococcota bacterium]